MYLVSKESNRKCRRSSNWKKLTYADGRRTNLYQISSPDYSRASHIKMEGARFLALLKWPRGVIAPLELAPLKITRGALSNQNVKCFISHHSLISLPLMHIYAVAPQQLRWAISLAFSFLLVLVLCLLWSY